jgi:anti-anti-sigma factor
VAFREVGPKPLAGADDPGGTIVVALQTATPDRSRRRTDAACPGTVTVCCDGDSRSWLIRLVGEHDLSAIPLIEQHTAHAPEVCSRAIVDLSEATFIDCSVINWLLRTKQTLEAAGKSLVVVGSEPGGAVARVVDLVGIRGMVEFHPTGQSARDAS